MAERLKRERTSNAYISTSSSLYAMSVNRMTLRSLHYSTILRSAALCRCTLRLASPRRAPRDATNADRDANSRPLRLGSRL